MWVIPCLLIPWGVSSATVGTAAEHVFDYTQHHEKGLKLSVYITAQTVQSLLDDSQDAAALVRDYGITKVYLEVYRGGVVVSQGHLEKVRDYFLAHGLEVAGGMATVPGGDFGVRQVGRLKWFNWQNEKTQRDLESVIRMAAEVFGALILDDFLCTADVSEESTKARGTRSWSDYRCDLLSEVVEKVLVVPAREVNPGITMIVKFPQWYDRFHMFGYDVRKHVQVFDRVWVGTESRGARTQRYGFVQPYEGFVNYRWIGSIAGEKMGGAWFDHGDCTANDFIEQAYQSVLAGAPEITIFNYRDLARGHPGDKLLRDEYGRLADLAEVIRDHPVRGIPAYKPVNSDAGADLYLMDFIGMLGVPVVPCSTFPEDARVVFLPFQAAADAAIPRKIEAAIARGTRLVMTAGFLAKAHNGAQLAAVAGLHGPVLAEPMQASEILVDGNPVQVTHGLDLQAKLRTDGAEMLLAAAVSGKAVPFLTRNTFHGTPVFVLNTHTYSQEDFDAVGEVLLAPRPLGLLEVPKAWANAIRDLFTAPLGLLLDAPTRVTLQPMGEAGWFIHNYNEEPSHVVLSLDSELTGKPIDGFTGEPLAHEGCRIEMLLPPRSRKWVRVEAALDSTE